MMSFRQLAAWAVFAVLLGWFLWLPLADIITHPDRLSVLPNLETDAAAYDAFAWELAQTGRASVLPSKHPPGWMAMLAAVYWVAGHSFVAGKLLSWTALVLTVGLGGLIAHRVSGRPAGVIAALLIASSPGLRAYAGTLQYEVVTAGLFTAFLFCAIRTVDPVNTRRTLARAVFAGLIGGLLVGTRETFVLVVPIAGVWILQQLRRDAREPAQATRGLIAAALVIVVAALPALAWSAVQSVRHDRVILIADKAREVFDAGHNPRANGTYNEPLVGIGEPAGFAYIRAYPGHALRLTGRKLLYSFGVLRDGWNVPHPASIWIWRATTGAMPLQVIDPVVRGGWLLVLCVWSLWTLGRTGLRKWWLLPATCGAILAVHALTLASYRFAVPLLPIFYVLASVALARVAQQVVQALRTPAVAIAIAVVLLIATVAQTQAWPLTVSYDAADLDGLSAANVVDPVSGRMARFADAARGERPVALLADSYLPRGTLRLSIRLRAASAADSGAPVARVVLAPVDGPPACTADVVAAQLSTDRFSEVTVLCNLQQDGPATLAVFSRGVVDLSVDSVRLAWRK